MRWRRSCGKSKPATANVLELRPLAERCRVVITRLRKPPRLLREPLFRLLAVNLGIGIAAAVLMLGGLLTLNPGGLRDLILADQSPPVAAGLLLFGLIITFGSVAMGTAIMMRRPADKP
jgi:hypothetical protein